MRDEARLEGGGVNGPIDAAQAANAVQGKPEAELDGRKIECDDEDEGEPGRAVWHDRIDHANDA